MQASPSSHTTDPSGLMITSRSALVACMIVSEVDFLDKLEDTLGDIKARLASKLVEMIGSANGNWMDGKSLDLLLEGLAHVYSRYPELLIRDQTIAEDGYPTKSNIFQIVWKRFSSKGSQINPITKAIIIHTFTMLINNMSQKSLQENGHNFCTLKDLSVDLMPFVRLIENENPQLRA